MYEENLNPLPPGDAIQAFAHVFEEMLGACEFAPPQPLLPNNVVQWAIRDIQPYLATVCRRLLLPGSGVEGLENLAHLTELAAEGHSCIICLNHRSNLDVPTLSVLLEDLSEQSLFHKIVWIAGRKLQEDDGFTRILVQAVNRVTVTPRSWLNEEHSDEELSLAHQINVAAHRAIHDLRHQGWVFALFPAGTRIRNADPSTTHAVEETDSYLKAFEFMVACHIEGCTLPVCRDHDMSHETPTLDKIRFSFGTVCRTEAWRLEAARRFPELHQRAATARAIMQEIEDLSPTENGSVQRLA